MPPGEPTAKRHRLPAGQSDCLAALPPEIIDNIISRLNIRDVVRTSALSRSWHRRWHSVRGINLSFGSSDLAAAISSVLKRSAAPVRMFHLYVPRSWFHRSVRWLRLLPRKRVQYLGINFEVSLEVEFSLGHKPNLDPSIFSCLEITSLCLEGCIFPPPQPPSFVGFLKLTKLSLSEIDLPRHGERQLEAMITASPLLLELCLSHVHPAHHWKRWFVRGPNLRSLRIYTDDDYGCRIRELPRLKDAGIMASAVKTDVLCKNLEGITHAESLEFDAIIEQLDRYDDKVDAGTVDVFANAQTSDDIFPRLRFVRLHSIKCSSNEMCFIKFALSKARSLELFCVRISSCSILSYQEACIEMAKYKRASPLARLRFIRG